MKKIILLTIAILIVACQSTNTVSEEDSQIFEKNVQTFTDDHIKQIDNKVESKEKEIMTI